MPDPRSAGAPSWPALALRLAVVAVPCWLTIPVLFSNVDIAIRALIAIVLAVTLINPADGLLLIAVVAPLAELLTPIIDSRNWRIAESTVLTFLAAWMLRSLAQPDRRGPRAPAPALAWLWAAAIVGSIGGLAWQLNRYPGELHATIDLIDHMYFFAVERIGVVAGARLLEGLGLAVAAVAVFRRDPRLSVRLPLALAGSAAAAALSSVLLNLGIGSAAALARHQMLGYRVSGHVGDVNAAGSYYAMIVCLAAGMAWRERGGRRLLWLALTAASGTGLWLSGSRSALGAAGATLVVAGGWAAMARFSTRARLAALAALIAVLIGGAAIRARMLQADPDYSGVGFRNQFVETSLRMIAARPLFGVGVGRYYPASPLFLSPQLAWSYGAENAHNYFLQIGGELGVVGLVLFAAFLGATLTRAGRALVRTPRDPRLLGVTGGVVAFLITCTTGHPFLVSEVAYPFWMQFGLLAALAGSTCLNTADNSTAAAQRQTRPIAKVLLIAGAAIALASAAAISTARAELVPPASQAVDGFYPWERLADGTRFRWSERFASLFVPADVTRVEIPVRMPGDGRGITTMGVEVMTGAMDRGRTIVDERWVVLNISLAPVEPLIHFKRVDLRIDRAWQPAVYIPGSADMRRVGLQFGEPRLFR